MLVLSTTMGCTRTPPPASPAEKAPAQVSPSDSAKEGADARAKRGELSDPKDALVPVSEDRSLDYVVYAAGGMPALTSAWSPADYMAAAKTLNNLADVGNVTSSSIPVSLQQFIQQGKLKPGDRILSAAVGLGWQYCAVLYTL